MGVVRPGSIVIWGIVIVEFYIGIVIVEFYIGIVIVEFYIGIVIVEFLNHYYFFIAYSTDVSYYMLGNPSCNSKRDKYISTWIRVQYRFIFVFFLFSELFGTRAYALVRITHLHNDKRLIQHPDCDCLMKTNVDVQLDTQ